MGTCSIHYCPEIYRMAVFDHWTGIMRSCYILVQSASRIMSAETWSSFLLPLLDPADLLHVSPNLNQAPTRRIAKSNVIPSVVTSTSLDQHHSYGSRLGVGRGHSSGWGSLYPAVSERAQFSDYSGTETTSWSATPLPFSYTSIDDLANHIHLSRCQSSKIPIPHRRQSMSNRLQDPRPRAKAGLV